MKTANKTGDLGNGYQRRSRLDKPMPAYLWNPIRWQTDRHAQRMTWAQRGLYRELLDESYLRDGLPADPAKIAEILAEPLETLQPELNAVLQCFEISDGKLRNAIIEDERTRQNEYRRSMVRNPHADAHNGAQPRTDEHNRTRVEVEVEVKEKENLKPKTNAHSFTVPDWLPLDSWNGFCEMRKKSRKPFTDQAAKLIIQKLEKLRADGQNVSEILDQSTRNSWLDVFELRQDYKKANDSALKPSRHGGFAGRDYQEGRAQNQDGSFPL